MRYYIPVFMVQNIIFFFSRKKKTDYKKIKPEILKIMYYAFKINYNKSHRFTRDRKEKTMKLYTQLYISLFISLKFV